MALELIVNGVTYRYPETGDVQWGPAATQWAQAVTNGMLQKAGGSFPLAADVDFGGTFGLLSAYFTSRQPNPAQQGAFRLANTDVMAWRNATNTADLVLGVNSSNQLTFEGNSFATSPEIASAFNDSATIDFTATSGPLSITADVKNDSITNDQINSAAAIARSKLDFGAGLVNTDISSSAAIATSKLAAVTASRILVSDSSGFMTAGSASSTEAGYLSGVTSAIQTQLNAKLNLAGGTMTGSLILAADPTVNFEAATKGYVDAVSQGLQVKGAAYVATTGSNITLFGEQTIDGELTASSRVLVKDQSDPSENGIYLSDAGAWTRTSDANTWNELIQGYVFIFNGAINGFSSWFCTAAPGGVLGVDPVNWVLFSVAGQIQTDGQGIELTGTILSLELDGSTLSKSASGLRVAAGGITNSEVNASAAIARTKLDFGTGLVNADISNSAAIAQSKLSLSITNSEVNASAAIARSKLAALTANRAMISDGSGFDAVSVVTATELSYVSGVTSSIQTQLDSKATNVAQVQAVSGTLNLTAGDTGKYFFIDTSAARTVNLPAPSAGLNFTLKDKTGQCATNNITVVRNASEQIEGIAASKVLQTNWGFWKFMSDGTNWFIVG